MRRRVVTHTESSSTGGRRSSRPRWVISPDSVPEEVRCDVTNSTAHSEPTADDDDFAAIWHVMARDGWCDEWGSAEQCRVFREWVEAGQPVEVGKFIREAANRPPQHKQ